MTYYDKISKGYNELYGEEQLKKINIILNNIKIKKSDKLLDVGCGTGFYLNLFKCNVTGVDPSEELLKQCKHKTVKANAEELPFKDDEFDWVISITAIHNFKNIDKALDEIKRVGKHFVFSILKKSKKFDHIADLIKKKINIKKIIIEEKDVIVFCINNKI